MTISTRHHYAHKRRQSSNHYFSPLFFIELRAANRQYAENAVEDSVIRPEGLAVDKSYLLNRLSALVGHTEAFLAPDEQTRGRQVFWLSEGLRRTDADRKAR
jgi:hypothetical protein